MNKPLTPEDCASLVYGTAKLAEDVAQLDSYKKIESPDFCPRHNVKVYVTVMFDGSINTESVLSFRTESVLSFRVAPLNGEPYSSVEQENSVIHAEEDSTK